MKELFFFSNNDYKINEITELFKSTKFSILSLNNFKKINIPDEFGKTFNENAVIKSKFGFNKIGLPCFADDSGICISALKNKPGIKSKRFLEENGGLNKAFEIIIKATKDNKNTKAFFQTTIALTTSKNDTVCFEGIIKGNISNKPMGTFGFHYDSIFIPKGSKKTYAQMLPKEKNIISHRANAINKLKIFLEKLSHQ